MSLFQLFKSIHGDYIKYYPAHRSLTGSVTGGVLLSYILRQMAHHKVEEIFNTDEEIMEATGLGPKELRNARNAMKVSGLLQTKRGGARGRLHYKISEEVAEQGLSQICRKGQTENFSPAERAKRNLPKGPNTLRTNNKELYLAAKAAVPKAPNSGKFQRLYRQGWKQRYNGQDHPFTAADAKRIHSVWAMLKGNVQTFKKVLDRFFTAKWPTGHATGTLLSHMAQWMTDAPDAGSNGNGHSAVPAPAKIISVNRRVERINFDN